MWFSGRPKQPAIRTVVGEGISVVGDVRFADGIRIDGDVRGDVIASNDTPSLVVIGEKARVTGRVKASHVIVLGEVDGAVESSHLLDLQPSARVRGAVHYQALEMHLGASVSGELRPLATVEHSYVAAPVIAGLVESTSG
jgi:cytoskeletal protein CcmA (bactofilin family)